MVKEQENMDLMLNGVRGPHGKGHGRDGGTRFSLPWSLLVRPTFSTFSNPRYLRPVGESGGGLTSEKDQVREYLNKTAIYKFLRPDGRHPRVSQVIAMLLLIIYEMSWLLGVVPEN